MTQDLDNKILKFCYERAIVNLEYRIPFNEIYSITPFSQENRRVFIRRLQKLESKEYLNFNVNKPLDNLKLASIEITLKGILYLEKTLPDIEPYFNELTREFLTFVKKVEAGNFDLEKGVERQYGIISLPELCKILARPKSYQDIYIFILEKTKDLFTSNIGWSSKNGIIFYGIEPFLTEEGIRFLENEESNSDHQIESPNIIEIEQGIMIARFSGEDENIRLNIISDFDSLLPDFYYEAGAQFDNEKKIWWGKYGDLRYIVENTGIYGEESQMQYSEVEKLKGTLVIKEKEDISYGEWKTGKRIHAGGQGIVFKANKIGDKAQVALKSYRVFGDNLRSRQKIERYKSEVAALKALKDCENVIQIIDEGGKVTIKGNIDYYFVMELADASLDSQIKKLDFDTIFSYYLQMLNGFECIHKYGIIHRDIKPQNILLIDDTIKISDFGINYGSIDHRITRPNEGVGAKGFGCPEGEDSIIPEPDVKCDIYSLGKLLYYLLSKGGFFTREKFEDPKYSLRNIYNDSKFDAFIPLFRKTMVENKNDRYTSIGELREGFQKCLDIFNKES